MEREKNKHRVNVNSGRGNGSCRNNPIKRNITLSQNNLNKKIVVLSYLDCYILQSCTIKLVIIIIIIING